MDFVDKVGWIRDTRQRRARVDVVLPAVELLVALEGKVVTLVLRFKKETIWLEVDALDIEDVLEEDGSLYWHALDVDSDDDDER